MKAIVCELCGSNDLVKTDGLYVCQHCGTKYTPEEAKKLMVDVSLNIERDETIRLGALLEEGRQQAQREAEERKRNTEAFKIENEKLREAKMKEELEAYYEEMRLADKKKYKYGGITGKILIVIAALIIGFVLYARSMM